MFSLESDVYDGKETSGSSPVKSYHGRWRKEIERSLRLLSYIRKCGFYPISGVYQEEQVKECFKRVIQRCTKYT